MKHPLKFVPNVGGLLADSLGIKSQDFGEIERLVERFIAEHKSMKELFEAVGELDISDEMWANFLYTFGWWDGRRQ